MDKKYPTVIGTYCQGVIAFENTQLGTVFHFIELVNTSRLDPQKKSLQRKSFLFNRANSCPRTTNNREYIHASIQYLNKSVFVKSENNLPCLESHSNGESNCSASLALLVIVWKEVSPDNDQYYFSSSVSLIIETNVVNDASVREIGATTIIEKIAELTLVNKFNREFRSYVLPPHQVPTDIDDTSGSRAAAVLSYVNRIVVLNLDENVIQFSIETFPEESGQSSKLTLVDSELVARCFWWAQWVPQYQFLAFAHDRRVQQSTLDDEEAPHIFIKPMLSVLQFHNKFPRESVLNMPLDAEANSTCDSSLAKLVSDPNIITSKSVNLKLCAHASGAVYVFSLRHSQSQSMDPKELKMTNKLSREAQGESKSESKIKYSVNPLHHNKTLYVEHDLKINFCPLKIDISTFANDQYIAVVGWPLFVDILDAGVTHAPSHHITLDISCLELLTLQPTIFDYKMGSASFLQIIQTDQTVNLSSHPKKSVLNCDDKLSAFTINLFTKDIAVNQIVLSPARIHQLMEKKVLSLRMKLSLIHYILVHVGDINVCKRIIYNEGKTSANLNLTKIYQEFIVGAAHAQTKKQLLPNMEQFLNFIPYCPNAGFEDGDLSNPSITMSANRTEVRTMLLSPSQRVFPHTFTDVWTSLWQTNQKLAGSSRFCHKNVADKLLLALQCYKPEALSKASTPMSPSSPMVCASLGDIAGMFGRRASELQLPFVEHESCTANKQEYIFSINLRELSMHLLKERKEYPLMSHTVAGKYVSALVDTARLLCHLACLTVHLQPTKTRDKGFRLIDCLDWETKLKLFMLLEHYALALGTLACPIPQGFTPFFAYLAYKTLSFDHFIWHLRAGTFELQIDLVKTIMADLKDSNEESISRKLRLLSLLPKTRAYRILNSWSHSVSVSLRARQHSNDLLNGTVSQARKSALVALKKKKPGDGGGGKTSITALDSFFHLLTGKANASDIDLGLLTEATMLSMRPIRN